MIKYTITKSFILPDDFKPDTFEDNYKCAEYCPFGELHSYDSGGMFVDNDTLLTTDFTRCDLEWLKKHKPDNCDYIIWYNK